MESVDDGVSWIVRPEPATFTLQSLTVNIYNNQKQLLGRLRLSDT